MDLKFSFRHMDATESMKEFISEKSQHLKKYFDGKFSFTWTISKEKLEHIAHCHIVGSHMDYFGESSSGDFRTSVEEALHKVETQVKKHKEIIKDHKK